MAGEEVACPRCGQRVLTPAHRRPPEPAGSADSPPPLPRRSNFPEFPVVLEPPEAGVRIGVPATEPEPKPEPIRKPWQARFVAFFLLVGGIWAFVHVSLFAFKTNALCCAWPGMALEIGWGVTALIRGAMLLFTRTRPRAPAVLLLLQVLIASAAFDLVNTLLGVFNVLFVCAPSSRRYYRNEWGVVE
jgi:hypothetical protein